MEIFKLSKLSNFICIHLILFSDFHLLPLELVVFAYTGHQALFKMMIIVSENVRNEWLECVISSFSDIFFLFRTSSLASLFCCKMIILNELVDAGRSCRICRPLRREREREELNIHMIYWQIHSNWIILCEAHTTPNMKYVFLFHLWIWWFVRMSRDSTFFLLNLVRLGFFLCCCRPFWSRVFCVSTNNNIPLQRFWSQNHWDSRRCTI